MVIGDTNMEHEIHTSVCDPDSEQFFRPWGHGLPFRRISSKRSAYSRHTGYRWRYHHAPCGDVHMDNPRAISKAIILQGAGVGQTIVRDAVQSGQLLNFCWSPGLPSRLTGIEFQDGAG